MCDSSVCFIFQNLNLNLFKTAVEWKYRAEFNRVLNYIWAPRCVPSYSRTSPSFAFLALFLLVILLVCHWALPACVSETLFLLPDTASILLLVPSAWTAWQWQGQMQGMVNVTEIMLVILRLITPKHLLKIAAVIPRCLLSVWSDALIFFFPSHGFLQRIL